MSSNDSAFVKAFSRRARATSTESVSPSPEAGAASPPETAPVVSDHPPTEVERCEAGVDGYIARPDVAAPNVPQPHVTRPHVPEPHVPEPHVPEPQVPEPQVTHAKVNREDVAGDEVTAADALPRDGSVQVFASLGHIHTAYADSSTVFPEPLNELVDAFAAPPRESGAQPVFEPVPSAETVPTAEPAPVAEPATCVAEPTTCPEPSLPTKDVVVEARVDAPHREPPHRDDINDPHLVTPLQAVWEVDVFDVPSVVADLFFNGDLFPELAERMTSAVGEGMRSMLVTSVRSGEGRSTVAIGIAMAAAAAGIRVALVDADTYDPTLADALRLELPCGWVDTIRSGLPIKEVAVHAVEDGVTLIPLMPPQGPNAASASEITQLMDLLRNRFELIIVDGPTGSAAEIDACAAGVDSAVIVCDKRRSDATVIKEFSKRLRESGVRGVGVVENFS